MNAVESIQAVINTLNVIPVCGVENLNRMLGCIRTLADVKLELADKKNDGQNQTE